MAQKKVTPPEAGATIKTESNHIRAVRHLGPREKRLLSAIARDWVDRQRCDAVAGATNSPDIVLRLRKRYGEDLIGMRWVDGTDRDGRPCRWGQYRLSDAGRERLVSLGLLDG